MYDEKTITAIRESTEHHKDNLHKLKTLKGEFSKGGGYFKIGEELISYSGDRCALCKMFQKTLLNCGDCPLVSAGFGCNKPDSLWNIIKAATTRPEAIKAEERMVEVLEGLLPKEEFKVGDRVKYLSEKDMNFGCIGEVMGYKNEYVNIKWITTNGQMDGGYRPKDFIKVKEAPMYNALKARIEKVTTLKEADDIMKEINKAIKKNHGRNYYALSINLNSDDGIVAVWEFGDTPKYEKEHFSYSSQCEKLEAFKKALIYLLDHSDIPKDIIGKEVKADVDGDTYKVKILEKL